MTFRPMLAETIERVEDLRYPLLASTKLDGIRALVQDGTLVSRKLKPIPNVAVRQALQGLPDGVDGELLYGNPTAKDAFRATTHIVMSEDETAAGVIYYIFDIFSKRPFDSRLADLIELMGNGFAHLPVKIVKQTLIHNVDELLAYEEGVLDEGYEGVIVRSIDGPYKEGRATVKQGWMLKLKRFSDSEARITGYEPLYRNNNEAKTNLLGRTERSSHKAGKVADDLLGKFKVVDVKTGIAFEVGSGFDQAEREKFWKVRDKLVGKVIKYKFFAVGTKDGTPRFPTFLGMRDKRDM